MGGTTLPPLAEEKKSGKHAFSAFFMAELAIESRKMLHNAHRNVA